MPIQAICKILSVERLNADAVSLWLQAGAMADQAQVGQIVNIKCGEGLLLRRPISICRAGDGKLNVVFEVRGEGTAWLARRSAGEELDVMGPLGHGFTYPQGKVLVAGGGIGVPPMLNTAQRALGGAVACLGFRGADKAMLVREFEDCCQQVYLSSDDGTLGHHVRRRPAPRRALPGQHGGADGLRHRGLPGLRLQDIGRSLPPRLQGRPCL